MTSSDSQHPLGSEALQPPAGNAYSEYYAKKSTQLLMRKAYLRGCADDRLQEIVRALNGALGHSRFPTFTIFGNNEYKVTTAQCIYDECYHILYIQGMIAEVGDIRRQQPQLELAYRNHDCILQLCTTRDEVKRYIEAFNRSECLPPDLITPHLTTLLLEVNRLLREMKDITCGMKSMEQAASIHCDNEP